MRQVFERLFRVGLGLAVPLLLLGQQAGAASAWFGGDPTVHKADRTLTPVEYDKLRAERQGSSAGLDCIQKKIARRAFGSLSVQYENTCWYATKIGLISQRGDYLLQPGTQVAGHIGGTSPTQPVLIPTPNDDLFLELTPDNISGYNLGFRTVTDTAMSRTEHATGTVTLDFTKPTTNIPKHTNGGRMFFIPRYAHWSADGRYMIIWGERGLLYRIDLQTFQILTVKVMDYPGALLTGSVALSPSGNIAAVAMERMGALTDLFVVDLTQCSSGEAALIPLATGAKCTQKSVKSLLQAGVTSFTAPLLPRFYGENTLGFYNRPGGASGNYEQYYLQAAGTTLEKNNYLALGDSFSAGEGAGDYIDGTDIKGVNMCHTSRNSYPYLIDRRVGFNSFLSVACSGAKIENYTNISQHENTIVDVGEIVPGKFPQSATLNGTINIVTISMSGNDIDFVGRLSYCLLGRSNCYNSHEERLEIANHIKALHPKLVAIYQDIMGDAVPKRRLYVVGYPQLMSPNEEAPCAENVNFNAYQRKMANDLITYFNAVIKSAAAHAGAVYAGTENALAGHRLCEGTSASVAVNGLTFGDETPHDYLGPVSNASYHPNQLGQRLLADAVLDSTNNLALNMPAPDTTTPIPNPTNYPFTDIPSGGGIVHNILYNVITDNAVLKRGVGLIIKYADVLNPFAPGSTVTATLHSNPVSLGQHQVNSVGLLQKIVQIPNTLTPGIHELRLNGTSEDGKPLSIRQFIFVYISEDDFDGDGVSNDNESCVMIEAANKDYDQDGIDDACDTLIANPPAPAPEPEPATQEESSEQATADAAVNSLTVSPSQPQVLGLSISDVPAVSQSKLPASPNSPSTPEMDQEILRSSVSPIFASAVKKSFNYWILAAGITLIVILGYSIFNYAIINKKD